MRSSFVWQAAACINNAALNDRVQPGFEGTLKAEVWKIFCYLAQNLLNNLFLEILGDIFRFCFCVHPSLHELTTLIPVFRVSVTNHLLDNQSFICSRPWQVRLVL